jgi:hypothetical protein
VIIPFFETYQLRTAKRSDFEKFAACVVMMSSGLHLTDSGLAKILEIMETMNRMKPRARELRILRDHTPDTQMTLGEEMVPSAWRHAGEAPDRGASTWATREDSSEIPCRVSENEPVPADIGEALLVACGRRG